MARHGSGKKRFPNVVFFANVNAKENKNYMSSRENWTF